MQSFVFSDKTKEKQYKYGSNKKNIKIVNSQSYIKNDFFLLTNDELTLITEVLKCKKSDILNYIITFLLIYIYIFKCYN